MSLGSIGRVAPVLFLLSCSSVVPLQREAPPAADDFDPPRYSIVYLIHGDGGYLYHDSLGNEYRADQEALSGAMTVAAQNPRAEVFIFHEKRRRRFLRLLWPLRDGEFYHYRNGRLLAKESYRRDVGPSRFDPLAELYHRSSTGEGSQPERMFLYFGHEIPEFGGAGYDASYKNRTFTVADLATGLRSLTRDSTPFDLVMLSTCFNGTPYTISTLGPYARYIIASPDNLHLSYFDDHPLERLDIGRQDGDVSQFAESFARHSFDRLTSDLQTAVTVAVYDVDRLQGYLSAVESVYDDALRSLDSEKPAIVEHYDCAEDAAYTLPGMSDGVEVLFRPARFGREKNKKSHSGWQCVRKKSEVREPAPNERGQTLPFGLTPARAMRGPKSDP
jgi:hypothetical protein